MDSLIKPSIINFLQTVLEKLSAIFYFFFLDGFRNYLEKKNCPKFVFFFFFVVSPCFAINCKILLNKHLYQNLKSLTCM
jgi:hypothetical protein